MKRRAVTSPGTDRFTRSEPFEILKRQQRSLPARIAGQSIRLRAEIITAVVALLLWRWLTDRMSSFGAGLVVGGLVLVVIAIPLTRGYVVRRGLAVLSRHRFRAVCIERRIMNWTGNLPLLLWSRPTTVGERIWVLLRAGINAADIERNLDHVASGCHAREARVVVVRSITSLAVVDIVRRDPLTGPVDISEARPRLHVVHGQKGA